MYAKAVRAVTDAMVAMRGHGVPECQSSISFPPLEPTVLRETIPHNVASGFGAFPPPPPHSRFADLQAKMVNPASHIEDMDRLGINVEVASTSTVLASGESAEADHDLELNRRLNDAHAEAQRAYPRRIVGSFTLPLQDVALSLTELERAVTSWGSASPTCLPMQWHVRWGPITVADLEALHGRGIIVFLHPHGVKDPWFLDYGLWNSVGQAVEETKALSSMIYEGMFDRFPGLRLVISHGGGYLLITTAAMTATCKTCLKARATSPVRPVSISLTSITTRACIHPRCSPRSSTGSAPSVWSWAATIRSVTRTRSDSSTGARACHPKRQCS